MTNYAWSSDPDFQQGWKDGLAGVRTIPASVKDVVFYNMGKAAAKKHYVQNKFDVKTEDANYTFDGE